MSGNYTRIHRILLITQMDYQDFQGGSRSKCTTCPSLLAPVRARMGMGTVVQYNKKVDEIRPLCWADGRCADESG